MLQKSENNFDAMFGSTNSIHAPLPEFELNPDDLQMIDSGRFSHSQLPSLKYHQLILIKNFCIIGRLES